MDLQKVVMETLERMHNTDKTCDILYKAIENCTDSDLFYHRSIVFDGFVDNENLIEEKDGHFYYSKTCHLFERDINKTKFDQLMDMLNHEEGEEELTELEVIGFAEACYREYVGHYFAMCLIRINEDNATIFDF